MKLLVAEREPSLHQQESGLVIDFLVANG